MPSTNSLRWHGSKRALKRLNQLPSLLEPDAEADQIFFDAPFATL
jgi:hypothetical protein